jgi:signal transduction histidine kinase
MKAQTDYRGGGGGLRTFFAPAKRATPDGLRGEIDAVNSNPIMAAVLQALGGVMVVLNRERQIVAVNVALLTKLGVNRPEKLLGLRPGEALRCVHADDNEAGCGTSEFCRTCGAAIAIVASQQNECAEQRECLLTVGTKDGEAALEFQVRASPVYLGGRTFTLLLLQDICAEKRRDALERVFFHDLLNTITALQGFCDLLRRAAPDQQRELAGHVQEMSVRLAREVNEQRDLYLMEQGEYKLHAQDGTIAGVLSDLAGTFAGHPLADGKQLRIGSGPEGERLHTDLTLLLRILTNAVKNALEATNVGGAVRVECHCADGHAVFHVWNQASMPPEVAQRVFQRSFTTKGGAGRGLGTYSMKLLGERYLRGKVSFETAPESGTTFTVTIPTELSPAGAAPASLATA